MPQAARPPDSVQAAAPHQARRSVSARDSADSCTARFSQDAGRGLSGIGCAPGRRQPLLALIHRLCRGWAFRAGSGWQRDFGAGWGVLAWPLTVLRNVLAGGLAVGKAGRGGLGWVVIWRGLVRPGR